MSDFANRLLGRLDAAPVRPLLPSRYEPITLLLPHEPVPHEPSPWPAVPESAPIEPWAEPGLPLGPLPRVDPPRLAVPEGALVEPGDEPLPRVDSTWPAVSEGMPTGVEPGRPVGRRVGEEVPGSVAPQPERVGEAGAAAVAEFGRALAHRSASAEAPSSAAPEIPPSGVGEPVGFPVETSRLLTGSPWQAVESGEETRRGTLSDSPLLGEELPARPSESGEKPRRPAESGPASRPAETPGTPRSAIPAEPPVTGSLSPKPVHAVAPRAWLPAPDAEPVVHITIGRVEVRAAAEPTPAPPPRSPRRRQALGLDEYLRRKAGG